MMRAGHWIQLTVLGGLLMVGHAWAEPPADIRDLKLADWKPKSMLDVKSTQVDQPKYPVIDVHNHLGGGKATLTPDRVASYLEEMNAAGVQTVVNLDGGWDDRLKETLTALDEAHPGRFLTFTLLDFAGIDNDDWSQREATRLEKSFQTGAKGLKFHKSLGLSFRYKNGELMKVDDPKLDPIWKLCAKYHKPVMIHTADPAAFFTPLDQYNERWHELNSHPDWLFYGKQFPTREALLEQFTNVIAKNPNTTFIGAHFGNNVEDLATVGKWLDQFPNFVIDLDARISELGRQPYTARKFFLKYQDRILFGTDTTPRREAFRIYYRFLETDDEYFDCQESHHLQGFWMIYGIFLPDDVLAKIYHKNAERILTGELGKPAAAQTPAASSNGAKTPGRQAMLVKRTDDFELTGDGRSAAWEKTNWQPLTPRGQPAHAYTAQVKTLYSKTGLYVLLDGSDGRLTANNNQEDFQDLWLEDVFEFFLWPDERQTVYFEYEISPLGKELPILIPNLSDKFIGWRPWHYEGERKIRKAVSIVDGAQQSGASIKGWRAEVFVPYDLLKPLGNMPPSSGSTWRANFYRVDYDDDKVTGWDWQRVGRSFHDFRNFGVLEFE